MTWAEESHLGQTWGQTADWEGKEQLPLKALEGVREEPALLNRKRAG